jgi:caffeoyl-CoA O-methyltransferase
MADFLSQDLRKYLPPLVPQRPQTMQDMEAYAIERRFPIIGPTAGYFCYQQARIHGARNVYELGSGFGYSTAWFARAVLENGGGTVDHVVWDEELSTKARGFLSELGFDGIIRYTIDEAVHALGQSKGTFDLIFSDINKDGYPDSLPIIEAKLRPGGLLIADNALLRGRIFDEQDQSASTSGVREFTIRLSQDPKWITTITPIRDGLIIALRT